MMKHAFIQRVIALLAIGLMLAFVNASAESTTRMYYTDHFSIELPIEWLQSEDTTSNQGWFYADSIGSIVGGYLYIAERKLDNVEVLSDEALIALYNDVVEGISGGTDVVGDVVGEKTMIDNKLAYRFGYDSSLAGGIHMEGYTLYYNGNLLGVTYTDSSGNVESIRKIADSFALHTHCSNIESSQIEENDPLIALQKKSKDDYYAMYSEADYDKYNSYAYENGLDGDLIQVEGIITEYSVNEGATSIILRQDDGRQWVVGTGFSGSIPADIFSGHEGERVVVYGEYQGFSDVYEMPSVSIIIVGGINLVESNEFIGTFVSMEENLQEWMSVRASREEFSHNQEYEFAFAICEGLVTEVKHYDLIGEAIISFVQKTDNGFSDGWISCKNSDDPIVENLNYGDPIELYYIRSEGAKSELAFIRTPETPALTLESYQDDYKSKCKEYTYKGIARNPEKVKGEYAVVTGEVIQVLEDGDDVELRVNITEESWGYTDTIYVSYTRKTADEDRILEDDIITIWGKLNGLLTYKSTFNTQITIPWLEAEYIRIDSLL